MEGQSVKTLVYDGHKIEFSAMSLTGKERVLYDGKDVSSKRSVTGSTMSLELTKAGKMSNTKLR
jgi:hypothetical protein